mmetsp:Transcript_39355/g.125552  ORF Transcript_39355/g.125552 Transcript_39355/m.125552 type:complete len:325 (+) Transcript_39355:183-1157(+)
MPPSRRGRVSRPSLTTLMFFVLLSCTTLLLGHVWINFRHKGHMPQGILFRLFRRVVAGPAAPVDEEGEMDLQDVVPVAPRPDEDDVIEEEYNADLVDQPLTDEAVKENLQMLYAKTVPILLDRTVIRGEKEISCGGSHVVKFQSYGDFKTIKGLDSVLPDRDMFLAARKGKIFKTCAVVGNSGSLLESQYGEDIDAHDMVIRFNAGVTDGYEQFVGQKTTFRILNNWDSAPKEAGEVTISTIRNYEIKNWVTSIRTNKDRLNSAFMVDPEFLCHAWEWVGNRGHKPSSGVVGVVLALKACEKVRTYGFQAGNYFSKTSRPHYYV